MCLSLQCRNGVGACPDTVDSRGGCTNDVALVQGWKENGQQCVVFSRNFTSGQTLSVSLTLSSLSLSFSVTASTLSLSFLFPRNVIWHTIRYCILFVFMALLYPSVTGDDVCDLALDPDNENQYIVWGVGGLGETAFRHFTRAQSKANTHTYTRIHMYVYM